MLEDATALVTGGTNGIGREIAITYAEYGADVAITDRKREPEYADEPTAEAVESLGRRSAFVEADVSNPDDVEGLFDAVEDEFGGLDVLVNNAGISLMDGATLDLDLADWQLIIAVNLTGTFLCSKHALPLLLDGGGSIVNISSVAGLRASADGAAYSASKAGVTNLTRELALDYGGEGVRANSIHPAPVETEGLRLLREEGEAEHIDRVVENVPMGRAGRPSDIAGAATFLASDLAAYVNGHALVVDGGLMTKYY